ncbi:MAG: GNAT family N-acetyltransferase [Armatimonadetes bacterium]|nr:GNAT family N-acetyltransferase [Armatimonadota bacterium]
MSQTVVTAPAKIERAMEWLYRDELRGSRLLWRLEADRRLDPPWPYADCWFDPAGAVLVDFRGHPELGRADPPWLHAEATDSAALELLCGVRLPMACEVLCHAEHVPLMASLGSVERTGVLDVYLCAPGEIGEAALPYEPVRLTHRHRAQVAEADWRLDDFDRETDEEHGVRWAILRDGKIVCRLLVQRITRGFAELEDVFTRPHSRRRGYGAALVQQVVRRLHERGLAVTYSVHPSNEPSRRLAEAVGFSYAFTWERVKLVRG